MRSILAACVLVVAFVCACGGVATSSTGADGGPPDHPSCSAVPPQHRPQAPTCSLHVSDAGACAVDADCRQNMQPRTATQYCFQGRCGYDQCAKDSDCQSGEVCACGDDSGGLVVGNGANLCVPADCHVDSDCGSCGYCAPSGYGCGPLYGAAGYYCMKPGAACASNASCGGDGGFGTPYCAFNPTASTWACAKTYCSG